LAFFKFIQKQVQRFSEATRYDQIWVDLTEGGGKLAKYVGYITFIVGQAPNNIYFPKAISAKIHIPD